MFTVCPKCALTLVVTAADLRVAQGYVRCGRCSNVFNALANLSDERPLTGAAGEAAASTPGRERAPAQAPPEAVSTPGMTIADEEAIPEEAIPEDALEFNPAKADVTAVFVEPPPDPQWAAATGTFKAMIAANQEPARQDPGGAANDVDVEVDAAFLSSLLQGAAAQPEPPRVPMPPAPAAALPPALTAPPAPARPRPHFAEEVREILPLALTEDLEAPQGEDEEEPASLFERARPFAWHAAAALATLALLMQVVNHYRDELAATARFNRPLTALYAALHIALTPRWDLHAYDVRQLGAALDPTVGLITVRASIKNAAQQPLPLPLLRVTLQDRFGNRIAARDVTPGAYLPHAAPGSLLGGGQRVDAEMGFVDPGANAVGFEIDACLPASGGGVSCANDLGPH